MLFAVYNHHTDIICPDLTAEIAECAEKEERAFDRIIQTSGGSLRIDRIEEAASVGASRSDGRSFPQSGQSC